MNIQQQLIFLFSALGGTNGLLLSLYFFWRSDRKRPSNYFLGALLLMLSIRTIKSVFLYFNRELFEFFIQFGLTACLLIGPFLFLYIRSMVQEGKRKVAWYWHILPYLLVFIGFSSQYSYYEYRSLWYVFIELIYKQWAAYILLSAYLLKPLFKKLLAKEGLNDVEAWILNVFVGTSVVWLAYDTSYYTSYIVGALSFTFILYISILLWWYKRSNKKLDDSPSVKYANSTLSPENIERSKTALEELMKDQKLYLDADLSLEKLSRSLDLSSKALSQTINQSTGQNYSQYIAKLRVEEAKRLLLDPKYDHYKIAAIAYESGFNSLSSFNAYFKKIVGTTANNYRKQAKSI